MPGKGIGKPIVRKESSRIDVKNIKLGSTSIVVNLDKENDLFVEIRLTVIPVIKRLA